MEDLEDIDSMWYYGLIYPYICQPIENLIISILDKFNCAGYYYFYISAWWIDHIAWRIAHYIARERCETCPNWHKKCLKYGWCDLQSSYNINKYILLKHNQWCLVWGIKINEDE